MPSQPKRLLVMSLGLLCLAADRPTTKPAASDKPEFDPPKLAQLPDAWFASDTGQKIVGNIVSWQNPDGGWYKHYDIENPRPATLPTDGKWFGGRGWEASSTIDNGATYSELRVLAKAIRVADKSGYREAFDRGLDYLESSQYPNGGFPQRFKLPNNYGRMITLNDDAMTNVMKLLQDISRGQGDFAFATGPQKEQAKKCFDKAVDCMIKAQITSNGRKTVWCQQHNPQTLAPTGARAFELPSACTSESVTLLMLLMTIENPSPELKACIDSAVTWLESTKISGKRWAFVFGPNGEKKDRVLTDDPAAPPLWARFYDIETDKPFFVGRDGVKRTDVMDPGVGPERRIGYAWYTLSPQKALDAYPKWKAKHP